MKPAKRGYWVIGVVAILALSWGIQRVVAAGVRIGDRAPDLTARTLEGGMFRLSRDRGTKATVIGLFHICEPCRNQAVQLQEISDRFGGQGVLVLGINVAGDDEASVRAFLAGSPIPIRFPYAVDPGGRIAKDYGVRATPIVYILDGHGNVRFSGSALSAEELTRRLMPLLRR